MPLYYNYHLQVELRNKSYADILAASSWGILFSQGFVNKLGMFIVKLHRKRAEYINQMKKQSVL